jgi:hypothetical protein
MSFALSTLLTILLHITPMAAGAGLSIYQQGGVHLDRPAPVHHRHAKHK